MNNSSQVRTAMKYGAFSGLSTFIVAVILYIIGKNPLGTLSWFGFWIPILFIVLGIQYHRDKDLGGFINYGRGVGTGFLITLFSAIFFCAVMYMFFAFFATDVLEIHKAESVDALERSKSFLGDTWYDRGMEAIEKMTVGDMVLGEFQRKIIGGTILSLIIAAFLVKKKSIFEETQE
jgi:hypothetical protein